MYKNIVIIRIENGSPSGVVRYTQMMMEGVYGNKNNTYIHLICLNALISFPSIKMKNGNIIADIPCSLKSRPIRNTSYWLTKYFEVVASLLLPHFEDKQNLIWHVQELFIVKLADILKTSLGGVVLTHLHIIPWKFQLEHNATLFNTLYTCWKNNTNISKLRNQLENTAYSLSDRIICVSNSGKQHIMSVYNDTDPSKIDVIYNGLSGTEYLPSKRTNEVFELLFVGRVSREKGIISLLKALSILSHSGYSFKLKLAGECSTRISTLIHSVYKYLDIEILGVISFDELKRLYTNCNIGVVPSLHEQCSYTAIEMMMFGMPMIVSDVDALSEMFEDEVNALKVPLVFDEDFGLSVDEEKLASAIIRLIEDETLRQQLGRGARENYEKRFTLEQMIQNTVSVYEQL